MPADPVASPVVVEAPAKLTLSLRVTGVRDDGYHLIDAEMVTLDLADTLTITHRGRVRTPGAGAGLTADGPFAAGMPLDERNLVAQALRISGRGARAGVHVHGPVDVHIHKAIPHGGGLGGGSADAAAVLRWAGWSGAHDLVVASRLGADIPFCIVGGRARVTGIGELIDPLPPVAMDVTLVIPPLTTSTPAAYRAWDELAAIDPAAAHHGINELEAAALLVQPALAGWRDRIADAAGIAPTLAGSGATWFLHGHHPALVDLLTDATVVLTRTRT